MKRNDVVLVRSEYSKEFVFYGRINRVLGPDLYEVVDSGKYIRSLTSNDIRLSNDYKGYQETYGDLRTKYPVWVPMTSLRRLKQRAGYYRPEIFRKNRKKHQRNVTCKEIWDEKYPESY